MAKRVPNNNRWLKKVNLDQICHQLLLINSILHCQLESNKQCNFEHRCPRYGQGDKVQMETMPETSTLGSVLRPSYLSFP